MVAISSTLREDLYVVYAGRIPDTQSARDSRLPESAGEVDLAGRRHRRPGHDCWRCCRIASRCWRFVRCPKRRRRIRLRRAFQPGIVERVDRDRLNFDA